MFIKKIVFLSTSIVIGSFGLLNQAQAMENEREARYQARLREINEQVLKHHQLICINEFMMDYREYWWILSPDELPLILSAATIINRDVLFNLITQSEEQPAERRLRSIIDYRKQNGL